MQLRCMAFTLLQRIHFNLMCPQNVPPPITDITVASDSSDSDSSSTDSSSSDSDSSSSDSGGMYAHVSISLILFKKKNLTPFCSVRGRQRRQNAICHGPKWYT